MPLGSILGRWSKLKNNNSNSLQKVEKSPESLDDDTASDRINPKQIKKNLNKMQYTLSKEPPPQDCDNEPASSPDLTTHAKMLQTEALNPMPTQNQTEVRDFVDVIFKDAIKAPEQTPESTLQDLFDSYNQLKEKLVSSSIDPNHSGKRKVMETAQKFCNSVSLNEVLTLEQKKALIKDIIKRSSYINSDNTDRNMTIHESRLRLFEALHNATQSSENSSSTTFSDFLGAKSSKQWKTYWQDQLIPPISNLDDLATRINDSFQAFDSIHKTVEEERRADYGGKRNVSNVAQKVTKQFGATSHDERKFEKQRDYMSHLINYKIYNPDQSDQSDLIPIIYRQLFKTPPPPSNADNIQESLTELQTYLNTPDSDLFKSYECFNRSLQAIQNAEVSIYEKLQFLEELDTILKNNDLKTKFEELITAFKNDCRSQIFSQLSKMQYHEFSTRDTIQKSLTELQNYLSNPEKHLFKSDKYQSLTKLQTNLSNPENHLFKSYEYFNSSLQAIQNAEVSIDEKLQFLEELDTILNKNTATDNDLITAFKNDCRSRIFSQLSKMQYHEVHTSDTIHQSLIELQTYLSNPENHLFKSYECFNRSLQAIQNAEASIDDKLHVSEDLVAILNTISLMPGKSELLNRFLFDCETNINTLYETLTPQFLQESQSNYSIQSLHTLPDNKDFNGFSYNTYLKLLSGEEVYYDSDSVLSYGGSKRIYKAVIVQKDGQRKDVVISSENIFAGAFNIDKLPFGEQLDSCLTQFKASSSYDHALTINHLLLLNFDENDPTTLANINDDTRMITAMMIMDKGEPVLHETDPPSDQPNLNPSHIETLLLFLKDLSDKQAMHNDLNPKNLLFVSDDDDQAQIKVIDFEKLTSFKSTKAYTSLTDTTREYLSPDILDHMPDDLNQLSEDSLKKRDMFAMGLSIYEILAKHHLFEPPNIDSIDTSYKKKLLESMCKSLTPPNFENSLNEIDQKYHVLLTGMLQPDPTKRFSPDEALDCFKQIFV